MTKRVDLTEEPYDGVEPGERVMYLTRCYSTFKIRYGVYRGTYKGRAVVESVYKCLVRARCPKTGWVSWKAGEAIKRVHLHRGLILTPKKLESLLREKVTF